MSAVPRPERRSWRAAGIVVLGLLAIGLGVIVGTGSALGGYSLESYLSFPQGCAIPVGSAVTQEIDFPGNHPDRTVHTTVTVTLPSSSRYASILAGQYSSRKERLVAQQCLFGSAPTSTPVITQEGQATALTIQADYLPFGIVNEPSVVADGLQLAASIYTGPPVLSDWPQGSKITLQVKAPGRQLMYSQPPSQRDSGILTWTWALTSNPEVDSGGSADVNIIVPLGTGERITALLKYAQGPYFFRQVGTYFVNLDLVLQSLLGSAEVITATLSLLLMLAWYSRGADIPWRALSAALLLPVLPVLVLGYVSSNGGQLPISALFLLTCTLLSGLCFRRAVRSAPLSGHQPALTGRSAGVAPWLPLASLPFVAAVLVAVVAHNAVAQAPLAILNITVVLMVVWAVSALVLAFTRSSLRAISAREKPEGSLADTGEIGPAVVRWYQLAAGVVIVIGAYAVGYDLASYLGQAYSAYRIGAASVASVSTQLASEIGNLGAFPATFLLLPVAATLVAAIISSTLPARGLAAGAAATATLAWATTSRALDLDVLGTSLPAGAWILTALVALSLRKPLQRSASGQAEPWLPVRQPPDTGTSSRTPLRIRFGRWLAQVKPEAPQDPPPPGTVVRRGPFRDARARANLSLAWATLLAVIPVAYLIWGTLTALPKNGLQPTQASIVLSQTVTEIVRWTLTGWLYGLLLPLLPGRVGPVKALWLTGAWFAASAPIAIVDDWTGNDPGRVWLFPGLQLLLFLTVLAVLVDLSTIRAWAGGQLSMAANWSTLLKVYNFEGTRKTLLYAAPAAAAVIAIGQQVISGTGVQFVNSLLSEAQTLLSGR